MRLGIDLGGTKIEGAVLDRDGTIVARHRVPTPRADYTRTLAAVAEVVAALEREVGAGLARTCPVGVAMPGSISPATGVVQNANSTWLNGRPFDRDLARTLDRPVRVANDADCFALSEATDGAAAGARSVFGVILGTGCGGAIVIDGRLLSGPRGIAGEWGHTPLPWPTREELDVPPCWCGRTGCLETWLSGPAISADHARRCGLRLTAEAIAVAAHGGEPAAVATIGRHTNRLARGLAVVVNLLDPEVIVVGGGVSAMPHIYQDVPRAMRPYVFADGTIRVDIRRPRWGDTSGVRGAAWLWP
jgi:fructokinase